MTKSSKSRLDRKAADQLDREIKPEAVVRLTELPGGGFTVGLGLHGARMDAIQPGVAHRKSIVDVMALALAYLARSRDPAMIKAVAHADRVINLSEQLTNEGLSPQEVMAEIAKLDEEAFPTAETVTAST